MFGVKEKAKPTAWEPWERERVDQYLTACHELADAIIEHAPSFLVFRGKMMAHCSNREFPAAAEAVLEAEGAALAVELKEALARVDWLPLWAFLRRREGDDPPRELAPLTGLVENHLAPLRALYGLPVRPTSGLQKPLDHCPLTSSGWPGPTREKRCVGRSYPGLPPWRVLEDVWVPHPVHAKFRAVAVAAQGVETIRNKENR
jgi:hypothetical protein